MITHFGLFWSAADVLWSGAKGNPGHLRGREKVRLERLGRPTRDEMANATDYSGFIGTYCLYRESRLVYVGEAGLGNKSTLMKRLNRHRSDHLSDSWDIFSWFGRSPKETRTTTEVLDAFAQLEAVLIAVTNPGFNKQNGTFRDAIQVFQVPHEDAEGDLDTKLGRIMDKIESLQSNLEKALTPKRPNTNAGKK